MQLFDASVDDDADLRGMETPTEIGAEAGSPDPKAFLSVVKSARDGRLPPPVMRAVPPETPQRSDRLTSFLTDVVIGADTPEAQFPLTVKYLAKFGAGYGDPRFVRIDTEKSYQAFCASQSPEMAALKARVDALAATLNAHLKDLNAHSDAPPEAVDEVAEELAEEGVEAAFDRTEVMGAEVAAAEAAKEIPMSLPPWAVGKIRAWREGPYVCASIAVPDHTGELRICTSMLPAEQGIEEMARHAASAGVDDPAILGVLPAMGCVLGAGTLVKDMAAAAPSIFERPELGDTKPCVFRIEPKAHPAIAALMALACDCHNGNAQACAEWARLADAARSGGAAPVAQAMVEAAGLLKKALK